MLNYVARSKSYISVTKADNTVKTGQLRTGLIVTNQNIRYACTVFVCNRWPKMDCFKNLYAITYVGVPCIMLCALLAHPVCTIAHIAKK